MKIQVTAALAAIAVLSMTACDQQSWSEAKQLYSHGDHGHGDSHEHSDEHKKDAHSADKHGDNHAEKKEEKH